MSDDKETGERIAKVMARAGIASRRDAERMIVEGRVEVNGEKVTSPARDILASDRVTLDGKPIDAPQPARLWLYYKPIGLVTSAKDEKGRQTVFDTMPEDMPRVMSVGRLDLTSEGLLLLTNDGEIKRQLELPSTGWLRKYRVRVNGRPNDATFDPLRRGMTIEGEDFQPMEVTLDKQQGANAWLTVGIREGKNREIRRAMTEVGLTVNRLIRVSYGPFRLNKMKPGDVTEVKARVMREQLGLAADKGGDGGGTAPAKEARKARPTDAPRTGRSGAPAARPKFDRKPRAEGVGDRPKYDRKPRAEGAGDRPKYDRKPRAEGAGDRPKYDRKPRAEGAGDRPKYDRKPRAECADDRPKYDRKPRAEGAGERPKYDRKPRAEGAGDRPKYDRKPRAEATGDRPKYDRKPRAEGAGDRPKYDRKPRADATGDRPKFDRKPRAEGGKPSGPARDRAGGKPDRAPRGEGKPGPKGPRSGPPKGPRGGSGGRR